MGQKRLFAETVHTGFADFAVFAVAALPAEFVGRCAEPEVALLIAAALTIACAGVAADGVDTLLASAALAVEGALTLWAPVGAADAWVTCEAVFALRIVATGVEAVSVDADSSAAVGVHRTLGATIVGRTDPVVAGLCTRALAVLGASRHTRGVDANTVLTTLVVEVAC